MDNSDVLNNSETNIPQDGPVQPDVQPIEGSNVIEQDTGTVYKSAMKPGGSSTPVVAENNHAESIANAALSNADAKQTFDYTSQADKSYDTTINTTTTLSNGAQLEGAFEAKYGMGDDYKAREDEDYSWNKLATEMASLKYDQEEAQARYESIQAKQELDQAASQAWNNYFAAEYSARQTQEKMGWSGGQQTASDLQVAFLQAETAANMYTKDEMQKYGVDTKLGIARMYAEADQKALALQYYQDAVDLAVKEANETGCYVPPEASEMMDQQKIANEILANPNSTDAERARAEQVNRVAQAYYDSRGFTHWDVKDPETGKTVTRYYGIETLQYLTHLETVRNNQVNEELQKEANDIANSAAGAAWASVQVQRAQVEATIAQTNAINAATIVGNGGKTYSTSPSNYYIDGNGNKQYINKSSNLVKYNEKVSGEAGKDENGNQVWNNEYPPMMFKSNGNYYVQDSDGNVYKVHNDNATHASAHANDYGTIYNGPEGAYDKNATYKTK